MVTLSQEDKQVLSQYIPLGDIDNVYTFKFRLCDNNIDRNFDVMTSDFLEKIASMVVGVVGLLDHEWGVNNVFARAYKAEYIVDDSIESNNGEPYSYVLVYAYTTDNHSDIIRDIELGIIKETSVLFDTCGSDICSICGEVMLEVNIDGQGICPNGHIAGKVYDGLECHRILTDLTDLFEWSIVAVPCQRDAGILLNK